MTGEAAKFKITIGTGTISAEYTSSDPDDEPERIDKRDLGMTDVQYHTISFLVDLLRQNRLRDQQEYEVLGENLFSLLFLRSNGTGYNDVGTRLKEVIREATEHNQLLRIAMEFDELQPFLAAWPWEYLRWPERKGEAASGFFIAHRAKLVLTRFLALKDPQERSPGQPPLKILFVAPSPIKVRAEDDDLGPVEAASVYEQIETLQTERSNGQAPILLSSLPSEAGGVSNGSLGRIVTFEDFEQAIANFEPHVVHFVGHGRYSTAPTGSAGQLAFTRKDGGPAWISDRILAERVSDRPSLRLVFLQACESANASGAAPYQVIAGVAQWLSQKNIPAVVAMHHRLQGQVGNLLARTFYSALADRNAVEIAINEAREALIKPGEDDMDLWASFGLPVLYLRGQGLVLAPARQDQVVITPPALPPGTELCTYCKTAWDPAQGDKICLECKKRLVCNCGWRRRKPTDICSGCGIAFATIEPQPARRPAWTTGSGDASAPVGDPGRNPARDFTAGHALGGHSVPSRPNRPSVWES